MPSNIDSPIKSLAIGKVVLVTGGSNDLGKAICHTLAAAGAAVILHYFKNKSGAEKTCREINKAGGTAISSGADISDKGAVDLLFRFIKEKFARLDILVNNAHLPISRNYFPDVSWEEHQGQINVMLKGAFYCSREAVAIMEKQDGGSIINILTSQITRPVRGYSSYTTAASALAGFTRNLAVEVGGKGIRVNMIAPGFVLAGHTPHAPVHVQEAIARTTPLGRLAAPEDIANAVLFFASDLSKFITGSCLEVDGGHHLT